MTYRRIILYIFPRWLTSVEEVLVVETPEMEDEVVEHQEDGLEVAAGQEGDEEMPLYPPLGQLKYILH
jgi:hypothetical protein